MGTQTASSADDSYCLRWNDFHTSVTASFADLRQEESLFDISLVCDGGCTLRAHQLILSACSGVFRRLLKASPQREPLTVLLWDIQPQDMEALLNFMYLGEVNVRQELLNRFLGVAERLQVRGLTNAAEKEDDEAGRAPSTPGGRSGLGQRRKGASPASTPAKRAKVKVSASEEDVVAVKEEVDSLPVVVVPELPDGDDGDDDDIVPTDEENETFSSAAADASFEAGYYARAGDGEGGEGGGGGEGSSVASGSGFNPASQQYNSPAMEAVNSAQPVISPDGTKAMEAAAAAFSALASGGDERGRNLPSHACPFCLKLFRSTANVRRHVEDVHCPTEVPCTVCGKVFMSSNKMASHRSTTHKDLMMKIRRYKM